MSPSDRPAPNTRLPDLRFASVPLSLEDQRALLQRRIALFSRVAGLSSLCFCALANAILLVTQPSVTLAWLARSAPNQLHLVAALCSLGVWAFARAVPLGPAGLTWLDAGATVVPMALYGAMILSGRPPPEARIELVLVLIAMVVLTLRAVVVPSRPWQTALVSTAGCLPVLLTATLIAGAPASGTLHAGGPAPNFHSPLYIVLWSGLTIFVSTFASRVVYGLRARAAEAERLGQYVLDGKIGDGGMGVVYRARHTLLRRPTAVKILPPDKVGAHTIARFEREVQLTSRLTHPNTVSIYDYGRTEGGVFYYAMELLDGVDLERLVAVTGPQDPSRVVHVLSQVCGALAEAHAAGLIHRDVKPANVILCERGGILDTAKVVDFGLVKDVSPDADPAQSSLTVLVGTPLYMAPEAILTPDAIDGRADVYAVGAVAYFLLTGTPVFDGASVMEVCSRHVSARPEAPSARLGRPLPEALERTVLRALEKKPDDRPASAAVLAAELSACGLTPWTQEMAREAWRRHPLQAFREADGIGTAPTKASPTVLTVDLAAREAPMVEPRA